MSVTPLRRWLQPTVLTRTSRHTSRNSTLQSRSVELEPGEGYRPGSCREEAFFDKQLLWDTRLEPELPGVSVLTHDDGSATALRHARADNGAARRRPARSRRARLLV
jgi:hypothetical protein